MPMIAEKFCLTAAAGQHGSSQIDRVEHHVTNFKTGLAGGDKLRFERGCFVHFKIGTMPAGVAEIFDHFVWRGWVAEDNRTLGRDGHGRQPFARCGRGNECGRERQCAHQNGAQIFFHMRHMDGPFSWKLVLRIWYHSPSLARLFARFSRTAKSSGSPISRKDSPNSIGTGFSIGAAVGWRSFGAATGPCRTFTRATAP